MLALLAVGGAVAAFLAGWLAGRALGRTAPSAAEVPSGQGLLRADPVFEEVVERHPVGVVVAAERGGVEYRNAAARQYVGTHVGLLIDGVIAKHLVAPATDLPGSETLELFGPPKRVVVVAGERLPSGRTVAFVDDITERIHADRVRTDFVANVSHELRTPIGALMVLAETLVDADDPEIVRRVVDRMQGEADRASRTLDDLLELSHLESGGEPEFEPIRLADVVHDAVGRVAELAARRDISISTLDPVDATGPRDASLVVPGDRRQLASAVGNLVENAVKYSDPGDNVDVRVRGDGNWGEITVVDEGSGIPQHHLDRIFERFYRVDRARSRSTGGTGLGLSIVRHVVQNHGGSITVESAEGEGTTFVLRLPLVRTLDEGADGGDRPDNDSEGVA